MSSGPCPALPCNLILSPSVLLPIPPPRLQVGTDSCTLVSGSRDTTLVIWDADVGDPRSVKPRGKGPPFLPLKEQPRHILYGHSDAVVCLALSVELDLVVSASADGTILFHTLSDGRCGHAAAKGSMRIYTACPCCSPCDSR